MDTQNAIADATKQLVEQRGFAAVTVTTIMSAAHLRRQTFYDHFKDKYDVVAWIYQNDAHDVTGHTQSGNWTAVLKSLVQYFDNNRRFYRDILAVEGQNAPAAVVRDCFKNIICNGLMALSREEQVTIGGQYCQFMRELLADGVMAELQRWMTALKPRTAQQENEFLRTFIEDQINGVLLRRRRINEYRSIA
ncbi:TetR/AcrR family transcriptional regulator C-terminal domain-containing protein [Lacticaseibacillus hulanensis]|uniref:TetR/AcrR family transcriptional regulator C-terminal domain-containing protein n=1 Tax=Lacticaseibacillus hulanensis TaxID=2493111 RepID=UPI000FDAA035|nr:TetR/AcrR family transcriptional regulator C-terminal domain-containing protein [Lacticaseibacillus hulanensis]